MTDHSVLSIHSPDVDEKISAYSRWPHPVLLLGETGVGKDFTARRIHEASERRGAFVAVHCAAIPSGLFESELFGFERGSFSGAIQSSRGLVRAANHGTLFLDEIGELEMHLQVKLLRLLDSGEVRSVGSQRTEQIHFRLVAATNVDLWEAVKRGDFRLDLLERLSVLTIEVPSLRDRREEIPRIARELLLQMAVRFDEEALHTLTSFEWPGNIRQLRNVLYRAQTHALGRIDRKTIENVLREERKGLEKLCADNDPSLLQKGSLEEIEKWVISERLRLCQGNRKKTAKELGIAKSTLHEKIKKWRQHDSLAASVSI